MRKSVCFVLILLHVCLMAATVVSDPMVDFEKYAFTRNELKAFEESLSFVRYGCEADVDALEAALTVEGEELPEELSVSLKRVRRFVRSAMAGGSAVLDAIYSRTGRDVDGKAIITYVLNDSSMRFHTPGCSSIAHIKESNREDFYGTREEAVALGYSPCGLCNP